MKRNKKSLPLSLREDLHGFIKTNTAALKIAHLRKELEFVGFLLPKLKCYDTLAFIYLACATIGYPVMLPMLRHWAMTGEIPYRNTCTFLFGTDGKFRKFSTNTYSFNMYIEGNTASMVSSI